MSIPFFGARLSGGVGWILVLSVLPVIGLLLWGLNSLWLHRLKKGRGDCTPEGFRRRARRFAIALAAIFLAFFLLAALVIWHQH